VLGGLVSSAAAVAAGPGLVARAAAPGLRHGKIVLQFRAWGYGSGALGTEQELDTFLYKYTAPWRATHPGVDIQIVPNTGGPGQVIADILAGTAPDVFHSWHPGTIFAGNYTLNLTPYVQQYNADLSVFNQAQLSRFQLPDGLHALPYYLGTLALAVNEGYLDQKGLSYPKPGWTWQDLEKLARAATTPSSDPSKAIYGTGFGLAGWDGPTGYLPPPAVLEGFGGAYVDPKNPARCYLDSPGSVQATEWVYSLVRARELGGGNNFPSSVIVSADSFFLPQAATGWRSFKWRYYDMPAFPTGPATSATSDLLAINAYTKYPDLAWDLAHWVAFEKTWQRSMIKLFLLSPALKELWEEWVRYVPIIAPPLADKNIQAFATLATGNRAFPKQGFAYVDEQANAIISNWAAKIWNNQVSVAEGLAEMTRQVNALEAAGKTLVANQNSVLRQIEAVKPSPTAQYAPPPVQGLGVPPSNGAPYVVASRGVYTLLGDGWDIYETSDNCVFACMPTTASEGTWICRVVAFTNLTCQSGGKPTMSVWAKAGLMARADLSDDAAMASPHVTGANQIEWEVRPIAGITPSSDAGLAPLVNGKPVTLMKPLSAPQANYLIAPVWLKLTRYGTQWTPYASMDGVHWTQLAPPASAEMGGAWVGIFCTAHNGDFGNQGYVRVVIDQLNFTPTRFVQLGDTGVPPAAGPVPKDWATMPAAGLAPSK
jgi:multiple sugar transport system substrate-binding protein